jgi:hypothetical protein
VCSAQTVHNSLVKSVGRNVEAVARSVAQMNPRQDISIFVGELCPAASGEGLRGCVRVTLTPVPAAARRSGQQPAPLPEYVQPPDHPLSTQARLLHAHTAAAWSEHYCVSTRARQTVALLHQHEAIMSARENVLSVEVRPASALAATPLTLRARACSAARGH